jgi:hypothetical protein
METVDGDAAVVANVPNESTKSSKKKKKSVRMSWADDPPVEIVPETLLSARSEAAIPEPSPPSTKATSKGNFTFETTQYAPAPSGGLSSDIDDALNKSGFSNSTSLDLPLPLSSSSSSKKDSSSGFSAAHFRRVERLHRHLEICCDVMKGFEEFKKSSDVLWACLLAWLVAPFFVIVLGCGLIPYTAFTDPSFPSTAHWRSLWLWALVMVVEASLMTEIVSSLAYEIEYGIVVREELPSLFPKAVAAGVAAALTVQCIIFGSVPGGEPLTESKGWLAVETAGFFAIAAVLARNFDTHAAPTPDTRLVLLQCCMGIAVLVLFAPVIYSVACALHAEYRAAGAGVVGYIIAILFPLLRLSLRHWVEAGWPLGCNWGSSRGQLCAVPLPTILLESWHAAFVCLIAATSATPGELAVMATVQAAIVGADLAGLSRQSHNQQQQGQGLKLKLGACCVVWASRDSKIDVYESADKQTEDEPQKMTQSQSQPLSVLAKLCGACGACVADGTSSTSTSIGSSGSSGGVSPVVDPSVEEEGFSSSPRSQNAPTESSFEDDVVEAQCLVRCLLWGISGALAPLVVLASASVLDVGPNRSLFAQGRLWRLVAVRPSQSSSSSSSAQWLTSATTSSSSSDSSNALGLVGNLLCVSSFHLAGLACAARLFTHGRKRSVLGTFSSVVLTHHAPVWAAAATLVLLTVFSVVLATFGQNSNF